MKTIDDALELRGRIFGAFEMAESETDPEARRGWLTFVVVGGGATGSRSPARSRSCPARGSRATSVGSTQQTPRRPPRRRPGDPGRVRRPALREGRAELRRLGVRIRTGAVVTGVDALGVDVRTEDGSQERLAARTKIWAAGVQASPLAGLLAEASGATCDRAGRIAVLDDCTLPGHPEVFAIGDMMALNDLPGVAEVAMQSGIHAANTIKRRLQGKESTTFTYRDLGSMATISRFHAVVSFKGRRVSGFLGWLMWLFVHITFLTGFRNRLAAMLHWSAPSCRGPAPSGPSPCARPSAESSSSRVAATTSRARSWSTRTRPRTRDDRAD